MKPNTPPPSAAAIPATLKPARRPIGPPTAPPMSAPATGRAASLYFAACKKKKIQFRNWVENICLWWCALSSHYSWQCLFNSWYIIKLRDCTGQRWGRIPQVLQLLQISELREMSYKEWTAANWFYSQNDQSTIYRAGLFIQFQQPQIPPKLLCCTEIILCYVPGVKSNTLWKIDGPTPCMLSRPYTFAPAGFWQPSLFLSLNLCKHSLVTPNAL